MASDDFLKKLQDLGEIMRETSELYDKDCEDYWNNLPQEDQLKAFYSVVKRIYKGEIEVQGSYRYVLYDVFGFGPEAYSIGMDCGYLDLHNCIDRDLYKKHLDGEDGDILDKSS